MNETNQPVGEAAAEQAQALAGERGVTAEALAAAEAKAQENWNSYLRAVAELDNYRKRTEREIDNARKFAIERFAQELVTVGDALEAGINAGGGESRPRFAAGRPGHFAGAAPRLRQGGHQDHRSASDSPSIRPGTRPWWRRKAASSPANTVLSVIQKGYSLNGRLLRPARVIVSKATDAN